MFQDIDDTIERDGFTLRARIEHDSDTGASWHNRPSSGDVGRISRDMPECPGLDYRIADSVESIAA